VAEDLARPSPFADVDLGLSVGDLAADWPLSTIDGDPFNLLHDSVAGQTKILLLVGNGEVCERGIGEFERELASFANLGVRAYLVFGQKSAACRRPRSAGAVVLIDGEGEMAASLGGGPFRLTVVVLRANQRFAAIYRGERSLPSLSEAIAVCSRLQSERTTRLMISHPPVLTIPDVFSPEECRKLIDVYNTRGQVLVEGNQAINYFGTDYKMKVPDHGREDRVDHFLFERATLDFILHRLQRVQVEVAKAFHYRITRHETLRIGRYHGARGGFSYGHRDNGPPQQHRRFALSINLNTEEFEGGELRFPEFGDQRYRPQTGAGFVFSSSLLHEAMQVTAGTRYVLLSFMFGES
jgi:predicted 2-oxoglutarate/Fe(II)-dependent dioxygenase YbiX